MNYYATISDQAERKIKAGWDETLDLTRKTCAEHGVSIAFVMGENRQAEVVACRNEIFYRLRELGWTLPRIGSYFGKDHTSVLHGIRRHKETPAPAPTLTPSKPVAGSPAWWAERGF